MAKKKTYAAVMDDMSKKLRTYETRLQEAQQRGDTVGMQDYGRRIQRVKAGMETLFSTQEASKAPMQQQGMPQMRYGGIPSYALGTPSTAIGGSDNMQAFYQYMIDNYGYHPTGALALSTIVDKESKGNFAARETSYANTEPSRIRKVFARTGKFDGKSDEFIRDLSADTEKFYNYLYGGRMGNGDNEGYKYRGRGFNQLTGKNQYAAASQALYGDDRLVKNPDLVGQDLDTALAVAGWYFEEQGSPLSKKYGVDPTQPLEGEDLQKFMDAAFVKNAGKPPNQVESYIEESTTYNDVMPKMQEFYNQYSPSITDTQAQSTSGTEPQQGPAPELPPFDSSVAALEPDTTALNPRDLNTPIPMLPETSATVSLPPPSFGPRTTSVPEPAVPPRAQQPNQAQINAQQRAQEVATSTGIPRGQSALERQIANNAALIRASQANQLPYQVLNPFEREYDVDERPGYARMDTNYDPNASLDNAFTQPNQSYVTPPEFSSTPINPSPSTPTNEPAVSGRQQGAMEVEVPNEMATQRSAEDTTADSAADSAGAVTAEQRSATNEQGDLAGLFGQLVPEQNKFAQYAQFLPDLYAAYQMEQVGAPVDLPSQTMARMNTDVNYNPIYAQARQQQAEQNAMIDRNVSNPVVAAALKRSAANQTQATMGQTMASEIDQERQLSNQYAQSIAENKNLNAQIAAQNEQQQIDFQNQKRAVRAQMLQSAGNKLSQIYGENQNRQLELQKLGLSALQFEGDMLGRMGSNLEAMRAAGLID